ncbi:hypothetical protein GC101_34090 [Paenibacillus sp. LMG 31459]|uniref:Uncharacterized protein n=1 Tax=Paenibacillus phytohabitans TaxID=2654978 RepID=A0ABX1YSI0_9BACL|nr:hypothetical protein [Paenibacillus phytohabitans]NOU83887.1 hypothetical protein [Paenibacillus phytohabitans]
MGLFGDEINEQLINEIIEHESFNELVGFLRNELHIGGTREQYSITTADHQIGADNYKVQDTFGALLFTPSYREIIGIELYVKSIVERLNAVFSHRMHNPHTMELIARIFVFNAIAHEYVHVQQFEQGRITAEIMEVQNQLNYDQRDIEIEAARVAKELLIQYTGLETQRVNQILSGNSDNVSAAELSEYLIQWETTNI